MRETSDDTYDMTYNEISKAKTQKVETVILNQILWIGMKLKAHENEAIYMCYGRGFPTLDQTSSKNMFV